jgi:hypothetical protein
LFKIASFRETILSSWLMLKMMRKSARSAAARALRGFPEWLQFMHSAPRNFRHPNLTVCA